MSRICQNHTIISPQIFLGYTNLFGEYYVHVHVHCVCVSAAHLHEDVCGPSPQDQGRHSA